MIYRKKGGIKILFLLLILIAIGVSAMIFSFDTHPITGDIHDKAQDVITEGNKVIVEKVVEEGRKTVGEKLKETGEKILEDPKNDESGVFADLDENRFDLYEHNILFFTAQWCPSCIQADENFTQYSKDLPSNMAVWRVDYDTHSALRDTYQISAPHVFILIDAEGNEKHQWSASHTIDELTSEINK